MSNNHSNRSGYAPVHANGSAPPPSYSAAYAPAPAAAPVVTGYAPAPAYVQPVVAAPAYGQQVYYQPPPQHPQQQQQQQYGAPVYAPAYGSVPSSYSQPQHYQAAPMQTQQPQVQQYQYAAPPPQYDQRAALLEGGDSEGSAEERAALRFQPVSGWRDAGWAYFFMLSIVIYLAVGAYMLKHNWNSLAADESNSNGGVVDCYDQNGNLVQCDDLFDVRVGHKFGVLLAVTIGGGVLMGWLWLFLVREFAEQLVWCSLLFSSVLFFVAAGVFGYFHIVVATVICAIAGLLNLLYVYLVRNRVRFAVAMLQITGDFVRTHSSVVWTAIGGLVVQMLWVIVWVFGTIGILYQVFSTQIDNNSRNPNNDDDTRSTFPEAAAVFGCLLALYWAAEVVRNVVHTTTAGSFASWYFLAPDHMPPSPTADAFRRATTTSFGSICLGSLLVSVIAVLRSMTGRDRRGRQSFLACILQCLLACIESIIRYINLYAFTYVAVYGSTFCEGAKATWRLLEGRGLTMIINDDMVGKVLRFSALLGGLLLGGIVLGVARLVLHASGWVVYGIAGAIIGIFITATVLVVVRSAVATLFVCFADDPNALLATKPAVHQKLTDAYLGIYTGVLPGRVVV